MARTTRIARTGTASSAPEEADVIVTTPAAAPALARIVLAQRGARRTRVVVEGAIAPGSVPGKVALVEGAEPVGGLAIQRALQLGADVVIVPDSVPGAAVQGAAAWYHAWKPHQLDEWAGALLAGRALGPGSGVADVDKEGAFTVGPTDRTRVVEELLVGSPFDGHASPEVEARLETLWVQPAGPERVRVWGTTGVPCEAAPPSARVRLGTDVHEVPKPSRPPGTRRIDDAMLGAETTMSFQVPETGRRQVVALARLVHVAAREHGRRAVLAVWTRDPSHWDWLEDLARDERIVKWIGRECHSVRMALPNLCAIRVLMPAPAKGVADRVQGDPIEVDTALVSPPPGGASG